jgi:hypothetical protein
MLKIEKNFKNRTSILYFLPFSPSNLEITQSIIKLLAEIKPSAIAIALPFFIKDKWLLAVKSLPTISVLSLTYKTKETEYLIVEPLCPLVEATRYAIFSGVPIFFIDLPKEAQEEDLANFTPLPTYLIKELEFTKYVDLTLSFFEEHLTEREKYIAEKILEISQKYESMAIILPFYQVRGVIRALERASGLLYLPKNIPKEIEIYTLNSKSLREILSEPGYFQSIYEKNRKKLMESKNFVLDRITLFEEIFEKARQKYFKETGTELSPKDLQVFGQFLRNLLLIKGQYIPDLYTLILAVRGIGGDEFAFWFWEIATFYEFQKEELSPFPIINLSPEDLRLPSKRLRISRKIKSIRSSLSFLQGFTTREERKVFKKGFTGKVICSFPPEDVVVETFGKKVMEKGLKVITENLRKIEPFTVSLKDGLDLKETIRKWVFEETPYVKEEPQAHAKAGSIVIIFEEDPDPLTGKERYPWNFTWHGEHHQESDMAFYSTDPKENVVGPGIAKAKYGGFMLTYPPMRVYDIWEDPYFDIAINKAERLLLAGIDYSLEKYIIYVAKKPPSNLAKKFASLQGKKVIFLPIGSFSKSFLEKIRVFHVLEGHYVRKYAHKYIKNK